MTKFTFTSLLPSAALALALVSPATAATVTLGGTAIPNEGVESSVAGATTITFDGLTSLPAGFASAGTNPANPLVNPPSVANLYAVPTADSSTFLSTGLGTITDTLPSGTTYFGFYWGSVDIYNTLTLDLSDGSQWILTGDTLAADTGALDNVAAAYFVNFTPDPGLTFTEAIFTSSQYSFEFDNVATATPEPASIALIAGGLLAVAGAIRRRKAA
jgi:hypothetical protein